MAKKVVSFLCWLALLLLSLRYRVTIKGKEELKKVLRSKKGGALFLPNHPAHVDPILLSLLLWPYFRVRPLVVEYVYRQSGIHAVMKMVQALAVPNLETALNDLKIAKTKEAVEKIIHGLEGGENFLLYPAGRLKQTGKEILGGASAAHYILERSHDAQVVLIRTTGLWGSSFSRAYEGKSPEFKKTLKHALWKLLQNGLFFMPRRKVLIEIMLAGEDFPRGGSRLEFNRYLEDWYNRYPCDTEVCSIEPLARVSYLFWKQDFLEVKNEEKKRREGKKVYSSKTEEEIFSELYRLFPDREIDAEMSLASDLGMDSLDVAEIITFLNLHYDIGEVHPEDLKTVQDILEIAAGKKKKEKKAPTSSFHWPKEKKRKKPLYPEGKTIPEAFFSIIDKKPGRFAIADDGMGAISYHKMKLTVLALAEEIKKMPGDKIGLLLPSTAATYIAILAIMVARKIPVLLNWTLGPRYLQQMVELTGVEKVISSWRFLERLSNVEFGEIVQKICYLEDIKKSISLKKKMKAFFLSLRKTKSILRHLGLDTIQENDTAAILFTSGTEAAPKGVPLSHKNILFDQVSALKCAEMFSEEVFYGILPPFHSFGFSVVGLLPILSGIRVVYAPDPTDSYALAEGIRRWKVTLFCAAPSFLKGLLQVASKEQLQTIRLFVVGAEKAGKELFRKVALIGHGKLIEGYGITECSPIITLNRPELTSRGVGQLIVGVEACTIHPETHQLLEKGKEGEICVHGENVFAGYLGKQKDPFIIINDKKWYRTGDLGFFDEEGYLFLSGRLKRFTKIGGEMISLSGIEEVLKNVLEEEGEEPTLALCAVERENDKSTLVLFTIREIEKERVNTILKDAGFSRLVKISEIKRIDQIPLMAAGKIDYRFLQSLIEQR